MAVTPPKTIAETRTQMYQLVRIFRARAASVGDSAELNRLADKAREGIKRIRKKFKHKIDDRLQKPLNQTIRLGLEKQLRLTTEGAIIRLEQVIQQFESGLVDNQKSTH
jgi:hypothetical protein